MTRPSVCMLTAAFVPTQGGTQRQCWLLSEWLAREGVPIAVLTRETGLGVERPPCPFPVHRMPLGGLGYVLAGAVWLAARGRHFAVLHAHQALSPALAALLAKRLRPRFRVVVKVACSGAWSDFRLAQARPFYRQRLALLRSVDRFVILNQESGAELQAVGLGEVPARLIQNGVDARQFVPATPEGRSILRATLGIPSEEPVALFVGRLEPRKGLDILLSAWAELGGGARPPLLLIAGAGERGSWTHQMGRLGLGDRIRFLGRRADVAELYRAADLFVLPSRGEGCPNALLEAMASGLPVVTTDIAGNREVVGKNGQLGRLVPPENPRALAEAVESLMRAPSLRRELGIAARATALERFDIYSVGAQYLALYDELQA